MLKMRAFYPLPVLLSLDAALIRSLHKTHQVQLHEVVEYSFFDTVDSK